MNKQKILIIGEVFIDVHLDIRYENRPLSRLGGIFHAARACASIEQEYELAYCSPSYLDDEIKEWAHNLNAAKCSKFATITNAPNIMTIDESKECGSQNYCNIIDAQSTSASLRSIETIIEQSDPTDILIFPGKYDLEEVLVALKNFKGKIHIDCAYDLYNALDNSQCNIETIILSTSSDLFLDQCCGTLKGVINYFESSKATYFLLKEGRGGSILQTRQAEKIETSPSYNGKTVHSVGVGDVYDVFYISSKMDASLRENLRVAAFCSALYAQTISYAKFKETIGSFLKNWKALIQLPGIFLPWEDRKRNNIYLAGPDFPYVDTKRLEELNQCLEYQNFSPRLPIRENGLANIDLDNIENKHLYYLDCALLEQCSLLIATLLYSDPGTFAEIGMFKQMGKPVIIYDPFRLCDNMFILESSDEYCTTLDSVINAVFTFLGEEI